MIKDEASGATIGRDGAGAALASSRSSSPGRTRTLPGTLPGLADAVSASSVIIRQQDRMHESDG